MTSNSGRPMAVTLAALLLLGLTACGRGTEEASLGPEAEGARLRIAASESALPLLRALVSESLHGRPGLAVEILPPAHSAGAIAATFTGDADIGVTTRPLNANEAGFPLQYLPLSHDVIVLAAHPGVGLEGLTSDELRRIYAGEIRDWSELGGPDLPITVLDRPEPTSPKLVLRKQLLGEDLKVTPEALVLERPGMMDTSLAELEGAIGYTSLGSALAGDGGFDILTLDGVPPTPEKVSTNEYPLFRPVGLVIPRNPGSEAMRFIDFLASERAGSIMESLGYSPVAMTLVVAIIPETNPISQERRYRPLVDFLSERLGERTRIGLRLLPSYDALVEQFLKGTVNAAFFGSFTYAMIRARVGVEPVARPERGGESMYRGLILARKDSGIRDWSGLRGRRFSMVRSTTAAEIFPLLHLRRRGVADPVRFLGEIVWSGSHEASLGKILSGEVEAGAAKDLVYQRLAAEDPRLEEELVVLAESLPVPENTLVVRRDLDFACFDCHRGEVPEAAAEAVPGHADASLAELLRRELIGLEQSPEGQAVLEALGADRFVVTTDADYENLYRMLAEIGMHPGGS
jgi:phosphate/phosphite/phosphonate ABC transporter binding protein